MRNVVAKFVGSSALAGAFVMMVAPGCARSEAIHDVPPAAPTIASGSEASTDAKAGPPDADLPPPDASVEEAGPARDAAAMRTTAVGKARGARCSPPIGQRGDCASGLVCCETGFHGHCGGANLPDMHTEPCVFDATCTTPPCHPPETPP
jgi:hypothetical protein